MMVEARWPVRPVPNSLRDRYRAAGWWSEDTLGSLVDRSLSGAPDAGVHIWSELRPWHGTYADVRLEALQLVTALRAAGIGPGDVVAFQLPNWREAVVAFYGLAMGGYVLVPIVPIYGAKEVRFILGQSRRPRVHLGRPVRPRRLPRHRRRCAARRSPTSRCTSSSVSTTRRRRARASLACIGTWLPPRHPRPRSRCRIPTTCASSPTRRARRATRRVCCTRTAPARGDSAHPELDHAGVAEPHGLAGHARHRHARRGARADGARRGHPPDRSLGSRHACST